MIGVILAFQTVPAPGLPTPPACTMAFQNAVLVSRISPQLPADAALDHQVHGTVQVSVAPDGSVASVKVVQSTGSAELDNAIVDAAEKSTYQPKVDNCNPVPGSVLFAADFSGSPKPAASAAPGTSCNHEGRVSNWAHAVYPATLRLTQDTSAIVHVTIGTNGELVTEKIAQSSGNDVLDQSALDAAKRSTYEPKVSDCKAVVADYFVRFDFQPH